MRKIIFTGCLLLSSFSATAEMSKSATVNYIERQAKFHQHPNTFGIDASASGEFNMISEDESGGTYISHGVIRGDFNIHTTCNKITALDYQDNGIYLISDASGKYALEANGGGRNAKRLINAIIHLCKLNGVMLKVGDPFD